eukprot:evm.model.scf_146.7 EVM.evm.TU.scf_146.7   scf_146:135860-136519(-)
MGKTADCPLAQLTTNETLTLVDFCTKGKSMRKCRGRESRKPGEALPQFQMSCRNRSCVEILPVSTTACVFKGVLDIPLAQTVNKSCEFKVPHLTNDTSKLFSPTFLTTPGLGPTYDCIIGWPADTTFQFKLVCVDGFFRINMTYALGGGELAPQGAGFDCIRDVRCGGRKGDGAGLWFESQFICYLPKGSAVALTGSAATTGIHRTPLLLACLLALMFL